MNRRVFRVVIHTTPGRSQPYTVWDADGWVRAFCANFAEVKTATKWAKGIQWTIAP